MSKHLGYLSFFAVLAAAGSLAAASLPGDPVQGGQLADRLCANCHEVERDGPAAVEGEPPAFQTVADDPAVTETGLRVFLQTPHENMPNFMLSEEEVDNVISYILDLR